MNVVSDLTRLTFAIMFLLSLLTLLASFCFIINRHFQQKRLKRRYQETFLSKSNKISKKIHKFWMMQYFGPLILSYVITSVMWGINEVRESISPGHEIPLLHSGVLILYSTNFYFPSGICIYLRFMEFMIRKGRYRAQRKRLRM